MVSLAAESWTWYAIATSVLLARVVSRTLHFGSVKRLQADDWLMLVVLVFYTVELVSLNVVYHSDSNLLPPGYLDGHSLTPHEMHARAVGSKWVLVVEQCQCVTVWLTKACLLIMYMRLTRHVYEVQHRLVQLLLAYVGVTFVTMELLYFFHWCRPFHLYWAVPTPDVQCSTATNHLITNAVFNLSSDVAVLCVALPLFLRTRLPLQRKVVLCGIFGLGVFVILCAALSKYYSFSEPYGLEWENWYVREASTAILVANLPFTWGMVRRLLHLRDDSPGAVGDGGGGGGGGGIGGRGCGRGAAAAAAMDIESRAFAHAQPDAGSPGSIRSGGGGGGGGAHSSTLTWTEFMFDSRAVLALDRIETHETKSMPSASLASAPDDELRPRTLLTRPATAMTTTTTTTTRTATPPPPPPPPPRPRPHADHAPSEALAQSPAASLEGQVPPRPASRV